MDIWIVLSIICKLKRKDRCFVQQIPKNRYLQLFSLANLSQRMRVALLV